MRIELAAAGPKALHVAGASIDGIVLLCDVVAAARKGEKDGAVEPWVRLGSGGLVGGNTLDYMEYFPAQDWIVYVPKVVSTKEYYMLTTKGGTSLTSDFIIKLSNELKGTDVKKIIHILWEGGLQTYEEAVEIYARAATELRTGEGFPNVEVHLRVGHNPGIPAKVVGFRAASLLGATIATDESKVLQESRKDFSKIATKTYVFDENAESTEALYTFVDNPKSVKLNEWLMKLKNVDFRVGIRSNQASTRLGESDATGAVTPDLEASIKARLKVCITNSDSIFLATKSRIMRRIQNAKGGKYDDEIDLATQHYVNKNLGRAAIDWYCNQAENSTK